MLTAPLSRVLSATGSRRAASLLTGAPCAQWRSGPRVLASAMGVRPMSASSEAPGLPRFPTLSVPAREPLLFTPGPLTTSLGVKMAMLRDLGSRDAQMENIIVDIRNGLLDMAGVSRESGYECVIVQGSGTFGVESVVGTAVPRDGGKMLILSNGAYGKRMANMCEVLGIPATVLEWDERRTPQAADAVAALKEDPSITHVGVIHHETTSGAINPIDDIGKAIHAHNPDITYIVDSMSAFGAYPVDMEGSHISYLVSSANKNIEGVPGFSFALCKRSHLETTKGNARSLSLDLYDQWEKLDATRQFRFTPPTHSMVAFHQAMLEHQAEGGWRGRLARYTHNFEILRDGLAEMGFSLYLDDDVQGCIISTFLCPDDPAFDFKTMYNKLSERGLVIYPGKLTEADSFRIGSIGRLFERDMKALLAAFRDVFKEMGVAVPVKQLTIAPPEEGVIRKYEV